MVLPLMTEFVEPHFGVDGAFKSSVGKLIPILYLIPWETTECMGCGRVHSYEWLILSETAF